MAVTRSLPVLMYHYINDYENTIAVSRKVFEDHCRTLAEHGWRGISLNEAEDFFLQGECPPAKSFLMTFDDGYLDNYLYAMPIMHRYGHKGVMFSVAARLEPSDEPRFSFDDVINGKVAEVDEVTYPVATNALGFTVRNDIFCNYGEVRAMEAGGILQVASHSKGHLGVYLTPGFSSFNKPGNQKRTFFHTAQALPWGMPNFSIGHGLANRGFIVSDVLIEKISALVPQEYEAAHEFFSYENNVKELRNLVDSLHNNLGWLETAEETKNRMREEIYSGKIMIEEILGKNIQSLCWPWGAWNNISFDLAKDMGFTVFYSTKMGANLPGNSACVYRFKAKNLPGAWLLNRLRIYSTPLLAKVYSKIRI